MRNKLHAAALAGLLLLGALAVLMTGDSSGGRPNILLILTDDQDLLLGSMEAMPQTRRLLGRRGATFNQHHVPLSLCCPSRATILTGLHTHNHGVYLNSAPGGGFPRFRTLGLEDKTLAVALDEAGYRTGLFGKYLNDYPMGAEETHIPPGWDEWIVPVNGNAYDGFNYTLNHNGTLVPYGNAAADYLTDVLAAESRDFVVRAATEGEPFFLYVAPLAPHRPATPAPRHARLFGRFQIPRTESFNEADVSDKPKARRKPLLTRQEISQLDFLYRKRLRTLRAVDEMVAALVAALGEAGQLENTYIFFTSDNGFHMGQHRLAATKYTPYEEDIRVPLLVRGPGVAPRIFVNAFTATVDLAPTIAALTRVSLPVPADGRSLVPLLQGRRPARWRQAVLLEQFTFREEPQGESQGDSGVREPPDTQTGQEYPLHSGLRTPAYKYVEYGTGEREYYDLTRDPHEVENRAAALDPAYAERLSRYLATLSRCAGRSCRQAEEAPVPQP